MSHDYLHTLTESPSDRARLVESLRSAAELLHIAGYPDTPRVHTANDVARQLLEAAAQLCDHARVQGARCRYCSAVIVEVGR